MTLKQIIEQWFWNTKKSANNLQFRLHHLTKRSKPMSDLPERIWFSIGNGVPKYCLSYYKFLGATEFIRADLAPTVGFSREQMIDALRHFIGPFRSIDIKHYMNSLTPVASSEVVPDDKHPAEIDAELWHERYKYVAKEKNDWQQKFESEYRKHQKTEQERGDLQTLVNIQRFKERAGLTTAPAVEVPIPTVPSISELDDKIYEAMPEWSKADGEGYRSFRIASAIHDLLTKSRGGA